MSDVSTKFHWDADGKVLIERVQDCTPILERATRLRNEGKHGSKEMRHVAHFPAVVVERYCNLNGISFHEFLANNVHIERMIADRDLSGFRVGKL